MRAMIALTLFALPAPALAQSWTRPDWRGAEAFTADQHRREMERLRAQADASEALARQQRLETQLTLLELQAARQPAVTAPADARPLGPVEDERARRQDAERRGQAAREGVAEIDRWLDRRQ